MFKKINKLMNLDKEESKLVKQAVGLGVTIWCFGAVLYLSVICGAIYFIFWCAKHFNIIG